MQFSVIALLTFVSLAMASPVPMPARLDDIVARSPVPQLATETATMTDASGNVVAFDSTAVFQDATAKGN